MEPTATLTPPPGTPEEAPRRRVRNYLIDSSLQLRFASYLVGAATVISFVLGYFLWNAYRESTRMVALADPRVSDILTAELSRGDRLTMLWLSLGLIALVGCLLVFAVIVTHRVAGPALYLARMCRQVGAGDLSRPRALRHGDLLTDLAEGVSGMIEALRDREGRESALLREIVERLRGGATPAEVAAALGQLEQLAVEKSRRIGS